MFLDTSGLFAILHRREIEHERAAELFLSTSAKLTHSYVLAELVALGTSRGIDRKTLLDFVERLPSHPLVTTIWVDSRLHERALQLLRSRADKSYSLCDSVSFVLMRDSGVVDSLTSDRHFEQEGFQRLLA
jgi:predicted nucleic acid-binding protein